MYIVTRTKPRTYKLTIEDIIFDAINESKLSLMNAKPDVTSTRTTVVPDSKIGEFPSACEWVDLLEEFVENKKHLYEQLDDEKYDYEFQRKCLETAGKKCMKENIPYDQKESIAKQMVEEKGCKWFDLYRTFWIPKHSGGVRQIDAPNDELMNALRELKQIFERIMNYNTYHTNAYAYIPKRGCYDAVKRHQSNASRWMLKLDFHNFFGSTTLEFVESQLSKIYPFVKIVQTNRGKSALHNCLRLCFLNGGLPQGTPISPLLTNIMMIPIDYEINKAFLNDADTITVFDGNNDDDKHRLIYTRYADDMIISSRKGFKYVPVVKYINELLDKYNAPFELNAKKTKYVSSAGKNWNLGLMLNQNNEITVGHKRKRQICAMLSNYAMDKINSKETWSANDVQVVMGNVAYLRQIEPKYADELLVKYNKKYGFDIIEDMKNVVNL